MILCLGSPRNFDIIYSKEYSTHFISMFPHVQCNYPSKWHDPAYDPYKVLSATHSKITQTLTSINSRYDVIIVISKINNTSAPIFWFCYMSVLKPVPIYYVFRMVNMHCGCRRSTHLPWARRCHAPNWFSAVNMDKDSRRPLWHYCDEWVQNDTCSFSAPGFTKAEEESR